MKATIVKVSKNVPVKDKVTGEVLKVVNLILLSNKTVLVRDTKQFAADLRESDLDLDDCKDLRGGIVEGDFVYHTKGTKYKANEFSKEVKSGDKEVGDELVYANDGYRVEGFLLLSINDTADTKNRDANAYAKKRVALLATLDSITIGSSKRSSEDNEEETEEDEASEAARKFAEEEESNKNITTKSKRK